MISRRKRFALTVLLALALATGAAAQERGPVTNLPLPRFASVKASKANVRRGPSLTHRIDWVFKRRGIPVEITAEYGNWRRVRDRDGAGGWVHYALLSGNRTVVVTRDMLALTTSPKPAATEMARLELGVIAYVESCMTDWCELSVGGYAGWAPKSGFWGVGATEIIE
jgi:SH3-like domain-containing protein